MSADITNKSNYNLIDLQIFSVIELFSFVRSTEDLICTQLVKVHISNSASLELHSYYTTLLLIRLGLKSFPRSVPISIMVNKKVT
jgi:hypothetical protein